MEPQNSIVESAPFSESARKSPVSRATEMFQKSPVSRATETFQAIMPAVTAGTILGMSRGKFFTLLLIVLLIAFAAFKLRPYIAGVSSLINLVRQMLSSTVGLAASTTTGIVDNTAEGTNIIVDKISGSSKKQIRLPEPVKPESKASAWKAESKPKPVEPSDPKKTKSPEPDETTSSVQSKSGYCYVGDWKGVRSCVKVNGECESDKVFSTKSACTDTRSA
jgi:hypothetical protein